MLRISDYNYPLADNRIAKYPLAERDHSKLLVVPRQDSQNAKLKIEEDKFYNIGNYLPDNALLVYNNTRVIQARLVFHKATGARIEVFCLEPLSPHDYQINLSSTEPVEWKCMVGNLKKWKSGVLQLPLERGGKTLTLSATLLETTGNTHRVRFSWDDAELSFAEVLDIAGELPIPPYLNRDTEESDLVTYQTVYSRIKGSVAAPTAGLHFTDRVLDGLRENGVKTTEITLHVGAGTFQPVKTEDANLHQMHAEIISVPLSALEAVRQNLGNIVAVGTTSVRTLESLYYIGEKIIGKAAGNQKGSCFESELTEFSVEQFEPYEGEHVITIEQALDAIIMYLRQTRQSALHAQTRIMIKPGFNFRIVSAMITNFHQPKSTLLLLVSAFLSGRWREVYDYALAHEFRFLSYGDSSLLYRQNPILNPQ